jgi:hypothetical protein
MAHDKKRDKSYEFICFNNGKTLLKIVLISEGLNRVVAIARKTINFEHEYFIESVENRASLA